MGSTSRTSRQQRVDNSGRFNIFVAPFGVGFALENTSMPMLKPVGLFLLKCFAFSLVFWSVWVGLMRPYTSSQQSTAPAAEAAQANAQVEAYENQVARVNRQLDVVESQQKRMEKNLADQEDNAKRFSAVLSAWEKQNGAKR